MLLAMFGAALALAVWFPETLLGGMFRRILIEYPARQLDRLKRGHIAIAVFVVVALLALRLLGNQDGLAFGLQGLGEGLNYIAAVDFASYLDVVAVASLLAATVRFREAIGMAAVKARQWMRRSLEPLRQGLARWARGRARSRRPSPTRPRKGDGEDHPAPGLAWA